MLPETTGCTYLIPNHRSCILKLTFILQTHQMVDLTPTCVAETPRRTLGSQHATMEPF